MAMGANDGPVFFFGLCASWTAVVPHGRSPSLYSCNREMCTEGGEAVPRSQNMIPGIKHYCNFGCCQRWLLLFFFFLKGHQLGYIHTSLLHFNCLNAEKLICYV